MFFPRTNFASSVRYFTRLNKQTGSSNPCRNSPGEKMYDELWWCSRATPEEVHFILPNNDKIIYQINVIEGFHGQQYTGYVLDDTNATWNHINRSVCARDSLPWYLYPESTKQEYDTVCYNSCLHASDVRIIHTFTPVIKQEWNLSSAEERELKLFANSRGGTLY